jgi:hypothetical protein
LDLSLIMNAKVCNIYQHEHSQSLWLYIFCTQIGH